MTNGEIFRKAADYIREHGWKQGSLGVDGQPRCAVGALYSAAGIPASHEQEFAFYDGWSEKNGRTFFRDRLGMGLDMWNDAEGRTAAEVIEALESWAFDEDLKAAATEHKPELIEPAQEYKPALMEVYS